MTVINTDTENSCHNYVNFPQQKKIIRKLMRYLKLLPLLSILFLSGCAGMMAAQKGAEAMQNGTQDEYIRNAGGRTAFETANAMDLSMLCGMYATSGKINTYVECTEVFVRRFKDSKEVAPNFRT